jgi:hypothetical protein
MSSKKRHYGTTQQSFAHAMIVIMCEAAFRAPRLYYTVPCTVIASQCGLIWLMAPLRQRYSKYQMYASIESL